MLDLSSIFFCKMIFEDICNFHLYGKSQSSFAMKNQERGRKSWWLKLSILRKKKKIRKWLIVKNW